MGSERLEELVRSHPLLGRFLDDPAAGRLHLVGGCVRDALLDRPLKDLDVTGRAEDLAVLRRFARSRRFTEVPLDPARDTYRLVGRGGLEVDVAGYRAADLEEDLRARDLSVNALAYPLAGGEVVDPTGGISDLEAGVLRPAGPGVLDEDPLRVLRVLRFAATLDFRVAPGVEEELGRVAPRLAETAGERRVAELRKLLGGPAWGRVLGEPVAAEVLPRAYGVPRVREAARVRAAEEALGSLGLAPGLDPVPRRVLLVGAQEDGAPPSLALEKAEARWCKAFARGEEFLTRAGEGDAALLPWLWAQGPAGEGAVAAAWLRDREAVTAARLVPRPKPLIDGNELQSALGVPPGPRIRELLDALAIAQARGAVTDRAGAEAFVRELDPGTR